MREDFGHSINPPFECETIFQDESIFLYRYTCASLGKDWKGFAIVRNDFDPKKEKDVHTICFRQCRIFNHLEVGFAVTGLCIGSVISPPATLRPRTDTFKKVFEMGLLK